MRSSVAPEKPRFEQPCNGCGYCCTQEPCQLASDILGATEGPCPALEWRDGRSWCGLVSNPGRYLPVERIDLEPGSLSALLAGVLRLGAGCDADDDEVSAQWGRAPQNLQA